MLTTGEMCDRLDVTYRQVDHWTRRGYVTPSVPADGPGTRRLWSLEDVRRVRQVRDAMAQHVKNLRDAMAAPRELVDAP